MFESLFKSFSLISKHLLLQALQRIIVCAQLADDISASVTHAADECARLLLGAVHWRAEEMLSESLLTYAVHAVERSRTEARLLLVLDFTTVVSFHSSLITRVAVCRRTIKMIIIRFLNFALNMIYVCV